MICAAKLCNAAAPAREHLRVLAPRLVATDGDRGDGGRRVVTGGGKDLTGGDGK